MCGAYAIFLEINEFNRHEVSHLATSTQVQGIDSGGLVVQTDKCIQVKKRDYGSVKLIKDTPGYQTSSFVAGHSRLVTNDVSNFSFDLFAKVGGHLS